MAQSPDKPGATPGQVEALGPTGERVAARLKQIRLERGLTLGELAARLKELGRPLLLSALSKIEQCQRRVDVDDLVALARALDVSPMLLLLPADASADTSVKLSKSDTVDAARAWEWMTLHIPVQSAMQPVRFGYLEQVRQIAPAELVGRETELSELADFCLRPGRGAYVWWQAGPWAGKTALLSTFVLHPPAELAERVRIVSFFVTAGLAAQDTRDAFTDVMLEQLAALLGQSLPPVFPQATREAYLLDLLSQAAVACEKARRRLVLVVDGLDEDRGVTMGPGTYSIAGLLPADPPAGLRVIVAGRTNPPVPDDVPRRHPLRDPATIRPLAASSHASDVKNLANRELQRLLHGSVTEKDVLGLLTAARGGLTPRDLADLAGAPLWEAENILRTVTGRTFVSRPGTSGVGKNPEVYLLAHGELRAQAKEYLGSQLHGYQGQLDAWASGNRGDAPKLGDLLQRVRMRVGMTQEELTKAAAVSSRTVSDLERGIVRTVRKDTAVLLADALGLLPDEREQFLATARGRLTSAPLAKTAEAALGTQTGALAPDAALAGADSALTGVSDAEASNLGWLDSAVSGNFVGRETELGFLRDAWSRARSGHRVLELVGGEPGIGKTALAGEVARLVHADGGLVLYGRWDENVIAPYQAFREALADYARACPEALLHRDLGDLAGGIARVWPEFAQRIGGAAAEPLAAAEAERLRFFESVDTWVQRMGARHPVLLVLDDLQWADLPSLLLLSHLMQARRSAPLLAVAMYRDLESEQSELSGVLHSLARDTDCRRLTLRGLEGDAVTELLEAAVGRAFGERESLVARELERDTAGNPFFLLEMARHLADLGVFDREEARLGATPAEIPESVRDMVRWRLGRTSEACVEVLEVASVIGERFDSALAAAAAGRDEAEIVDLLDEAARAELIAEIDDEPDYWRFSHSLMRRVTAERLSRGRRARLHQRIGEALESRFGVAPAELAHHFGAAASIGSAEKAVRYERLAAERALAEVAAEVAVRHLRKALQLLDRFGPRDQALRCELLLELASAHDRAGEYASRDQRFAEAADAARAVGNSDLFLRAALGYGGILPATVSPDHRAQALLEDALQRLDETDSAARAIVLARLAHWLHTERPYPERREFSDRSLAMARGTGDRRTLATVLMHRAWALDGPDDVDDALHVSSEILGIATDLGDPELRLEGLRIRLAAQFERGDHPAAMRTAHALKELAEEVRYPEFIRLAAMWDTTVASLEGRFADAGQFAAELGRRFPQTAHSQARIVSLTQVFPWSVLRGQSSKYISTLEELSAYQPANIAWPALTAWCLAETGALDRADVLLRRTEPAAVATADKNYQWWAVIVGFAGAADLTGDRQWAEVLYDLAAPYSGHNCTLGVATFLGAADHWLGVLAGVAGRFTEATGHLEAALRRHQDMGSRPLSALTEQAYGRVLTMRGEAADIERARRLTASAMRTAEELGLATIVNRPRG
jgi:transcriptional regulator with XRE-family HTH domain/tetratricopeptide (TPR) repeat protein